MKSFVLVLINLALVLIGMMSVNAFAVGKYANIGINANINRRYTDNYASVRKSAGGEIGIPLTNFVEISGGFNYTEEVYDYTTFYQDNLKKRGYSLPDEGVLQIDIIRDYYLNVGVGYPIGIVTPSVFGGGMVREICTQNSFGDEGCTKQQLTWNAGIALSVSLTQRVSIKFSYRISPSPLNVSKEKRYDDTYTLGVVLGI